MMSIHGTSTEGNMSFYVLSDEEVKERNEFPPRKYVWKPFERFVKDGWSPELMAAYEAHVADWERWTDEQEIRTLAQEVDRLYAEAQLKKDSLWARYRRDTSKSYDEVMKLLK